MQGGLVVKTKTILFFEKPGCRGNARQKEVLKNHGFEVTVKSLIDEPWTEKTLRPFLNQMPVSSWFNPNAVDVKNGTVIPESYDEAAAIQALVEDPLLIRRPLMVYEGKNYCGFGDEVKKALSISTANEDFESCRHT